MYINLYIRYKCQISCSHSFTQKAPQIYLEKYEADSNKHNQDAQDALSFLIDLAEQFCEIKKRTGRTEPTVIT